MQFPVQSLIVPIARRSLCDSCYGPPDVGFVDPMIRRRLSSLAKMTLRAAYDCAHDIPNVRIVFASRHGELARTTTMLEGLAVKEDLSPSMFSMSVLNAGVGLFSILRKITAPVTAISAGKASFGYGLLEACMQLTDNPGQPVLFVYADEPVPPVYGEQDNSGGSAHALGLLLEPSAEMRIACSEGTDNVVPNGEMQSRAFLRCFEQGGASWSDAGKLWRWEREA